MHVNELNKTVFKEDYKNKRNTKEVEFMETIENLSDALMSNNDSFDSNACSKTSSSKRVNVKGNEKQKKDNLKNKNKNVPNDKKKEEITPTYIPQIYETYDSNPIEESQTYNNNEYQIGFNIIPNILAIFYIIITLVIILQSYLSKDHIIIKIINIVKLKLLDLLKTLPITKNLMNKITSSIIVTHLFLDDLMVKSNLMKPYIEAIKGIITEYFFLILFIILMYFISSFILHIIFEIIAMKREKDLLEKENVVLVTNKMTVEEYEDMSFTYSELAKLHDDKDFICLKNKRAGEGIELWNWQIRKHKNQSNDIDICSDIELSDMDEN
ncbi:conserved Plasmodium protein, unknown function [Plasmodium malariae]|uniref:Uncharacterized protein n=1 Tax=Plasmodium malariae TaxID=5858 RepID=A0A1D3SPE5_PLAMA|nr:conserved Plasmodium protein, unknown function [Plasmodium malariae]SCO93765.1 conserved Plasmodium protein, unknown function [Plasmodium malariae]